MANDSSSTSAGGTQPAGNPAWLGGAARRVIDRAFEAFAWRAKPAVVSSKRERRFFSRGTEVRAARRVLTGVSVGDVDDKRFDAAFPIYAFFYLALTPEAGLYYTPALISRFVREAERPRREKVGGTGWTEEYVGDLTGSMLSHLRSHPFHLGWPVTEWPHFLDAAAGDKDALAHPDIVAYVAEEGGRPLESECWLFMERTRGWLMIPTPPGRFDGSTWCRTLRFVSLMTIEERHALVAFLDYAMTCDIRHDSRSLASSKAMLAGRGVMDVLCIRTAAECIEFADVLQALETRHPKDFPPQNVAPVKNLLRDIAAGRRSPDTKLGW